jgi:hypothetical protein
MRLILQPPDQLFRRKRGKLMAPMPKRKHPGAVALGKLGGRARAIRLSPERRREIARMGGYAKKLVLDEKRRTA